MYWDKKGHWEKLSFENIASIIHSRYLNWVDYDVVNIKINDAKERISVRFYRNFFDKKWLDIDYSNLATIIGATRIEIIKWWGVSDFKIEDNFLLVKWINRGKEMSAEQYEGRYGWGIYWRKHTIYNE